MQVMPLLIGLLVLASVAVDGAVARAVLGMAGHAGGEPGLLRLLLVALLVGQTTLVAAWSVWSRAGLIWRGLAVLGMVAAAGQVLGRLLHPPSASLVPVWTILVAGHSLGAMLALMVARRWGFGLGWPGRREDRVRHGHRRQFSLAALMSLLTLTAIGLGLFRTALQEASSHFPPAGFWGAALLIDAALAMLSCVALKLWLSPGITPHAVMSAVAAILVAVGLLRGSGPMGGWAVAFQLCLLQAGCLTAMLLVLRVAGFRLEPAGGGITAEGGDGGKAAEGPGGGVTDAGMPSFAMGIPALRPPP